MFPRYIRGEVPSLFDANGSHSGSDRLNPYGLMTVDQPRAQSVGRAVAGPYDEVMSRIAVVEDDHTLAGVIASYLERAGHEAQLAEDGLAGAELILDSAIGDEPAVDLVLLDLMLPKLDGLELCRRIHSRFPELPVIMLTALGDVDDRISGLEVGADDYVTKPFSPRELVLRVESVLRRSAGPTARRSPRLSVGLLELDPSARQASRNGEPLNLTVREFDLLAYLMAHPGTAFSREQLMREVWGWTFGDHSTVTVHVRRLREKVERVPTSPTVIQTVWGVGYRLADPAADPVGTSA